MQLSGTVYTIRNPRPFSHDFLLARVTPESFIITLESEAALAFYFYSAK